MKEVSRVLLEKKNAGLVAEMIGKLRDNYCKVDSSKLVNQIVEIFFQKYVEQEHGNVAAKFFDKRGYLRNIINTASLEELDTSIKDYLGKGRADKVRRQRSKKHMPTPALVD